jgi:hypothetical protein
MKSSFKDAEKNGSLLPVYREPAFAHPHTTVIETKTLERVEVGKQKTKPKRVFGARYSATNESVDLHEIDASVYEDPMLNLALAQGSSKKSKQALDYTYIESPELKSDHHVAAPEDYAYVNVEPGKLKEGSGLPEESDSTYRNLAFVGDAGEVRLNDGQKNSDGTYERLDSSMEENVYTKLGQTQNGSNDIMIQDGIYVLETPTGEGSKIEDTIAGTDVGADKSAYHTLESDHDKGTIPGTDPVDGNEYSLCQSPNQGNEYPNQVLTEQDTEGHTVYDFTNDKNEPVTTGSEPGEGGNMYAIYDDSHHPDPTMENSDAELNTIENLYAIYDDTQSKC